MESPKIGVGKFNNSTRDKTRSVIQNYSTSADAKEEEKQVKPGRKKGRNKQAISITIDKELYEILQEKHETTRHSISLLVEDAIREYYK